MKISDIHGQAMDKTFAAFVKENALEAVKHFSVILHNDEFDRCSPEVQGMLKRHIGLLIGETQVRLLEGVNRHFPDLDDLR